MTQPNAKRVVGLFGHSGTGKTTAAETILFNAKEIDRICRVETGGTVMDFDPDETKRVMSLNLGIANYKWKDCSVNIIDIPGYIDFQGEVYKAIRVVDSLVLFVNAGSGVEVETEKHWTLASDANLPRLFFINKMDQENADFQKAAGEITQIFSAKAVPLVIPYGTGPKFSGIIDLLPRKLYKFAASGEVAVSDVPADIKDQAEKARDRLVEAIAEVNDNLIEKYLNGEELTEEEIKTGLKNGIKSSSLFPILCGSALNNFGIKKLMDAISEYLPSPLDRPAVPAKLNEEDVMVKPDPSEPFSAFVFKTLSEPHMGDITLFRVYSGSFSPGNDLFNTTKGQKERIGQLFSVIGKNRKDLPVAETGDICAVVKLKYTHTGDTFTTQKAQVVFPQVDFPEPLSEVAVTPKTKADQEKLSSALSKIAEEDPTIKIHHNHELSQTILSGYGDVHLEVTIDRLVRKYGVEIIMEEPKIAYRETIKRRAKSEHKHKKQSGGRGQYGHVLLELEPMNEEGKSFEFVDKIFGGSVPRQYVPAVEKGVVEAMERGVLAGFKVINVRAIIFDGSYHTVDSSELAFKIAGSMAFKKGFMEAGPILLEPIMELSVKGGNDYTGQIIGDLNGRRGHILGMEPGERYQTVKATVPKAELNKYSADLRSMTSGRGSFGLKFSHYQEVPAHLTQKIIDAAKKDKVEVEE